MFTKYLSGSSFFNKAANSKPTTLMTVNPLIGTFKILVRFFRVNMNLIVQFSKCRPFNVGFKISHNCERMK